MGCVLLSIGIVFAKNLSQEDNTPLSFYTEHLTLSILLPGVAAIQNLEKSNGRRIVFKITNKWF